jgi:hypothetical protein
MTWQPIESAPRKREVVLLKLREEDGFVFARWGQDYIGRRGWLNGYTGDELIGGEPTHWMKLPPAPPEDQP